MDSEKVIDALEYACEDDGRPSLSKPFRDGRYMVASNGKLIFRHLVAEGESGYPEEFEGHPKTPKCFPEGEEWDKATSFTLDEVKKFLGFKARYGEHLVNGVRRNPEDLEEYQCPCCRERLYIRDRELVDADKDDESYDNRFGFDIVPPSGEKVIALGYILNKFVRTILAFVEGDESRLAKVEMRLVDSGRYVVAARGDGFEGVMIVYPRDRHDRYRTLESMKIGVVS